MEAKLVIESVVRELIDGEREPLRVSDGDSDAKPLLDDNELSVTVCEADGGADTVTDGHADAESSALND